MTHLGIIIHGNSIIQAVLITDMEMHRLQVEEI